MTATRGEFRGHPTLTLTDGQRNDFEFTFGVAKAKLILAHLREIRKFVKEVG